MLNRLLKMMVLCVGVVGLTPVFSFATWTPLITSDSFTGMITDLGTTATGIITALLVVLGVGLLARIFSR